MKKTKSLFLLLAALLPLTGMQAKEVSEAEAAKMAKQLMAERVEQFKGDVGSVTPVSYEGQRAYYVVQFRQGGWALIAADDMSQPLIGYNAEGVFPQDDQPENLNGMLGIWSQEVVRNSRLQGDRHAEWEEPSQTEKARRAGASGDKVSPLITVNWNQTGNYKKYCPTNNDGQAVVGCVAVGMAQAMSVAQWPMRPTGSFSYVSKSYGLLSINYDEEPAYDWDAILSGANKLDDVARLLWHCGVAVKMDYGVDGSGTQSSYIATALQRNFGYPQSVKIYTRDTYDGDWTELILNELMEGRAVAYSGADPKKNYGHCFNLDGYDGQFFHVNWGWGATGNGYFSLDALRDAKMDMDYTDGQDVIVGIRRPSEKPSNITLSSKSVAAGQPQGTYVADVIVESEATDPVYSFELKGKYNPITHKNVAAKFYVEDGKLYTTEVLNAGTQSLTIKATNVSNLGSVERTFSIRVTDTNGIVEYRQEAAHVVSTGYFTATGKRLSQAPLRGLYIEQLRLSNGEVKNIKKYNR